MDRFKEFGFEKYFYDTKNDVVINKRTLKPRKWCSKKGANTYHVVLSTYGKQITITKNEILRRTLSIEQQIHRIDENYLTKYKK